MPDGRTHALASASIAVILTGVAVSAQSTYGSSVFLLPTGALAGILFSPDLDVDVGNESDFIIRKKLGVIPQFFWRVFWTPYARLMPHRSNLSHFPGISTAIRVAYVLIPCAVVLALLGYPLLDNLVWLLSWTAFRWWFLGLAAADALHAVMDAL